MIVHYCEENKKIGGHLGKVPIYFIVHTWVFMNSRHHSTSLTTLDNVIFYGIPHPHFGDPAADPQISSIS